MYIQKWNINTIHYTYDLCLLNNNVIISWQIDATLIIVNFYVYYDDPHLQHRGSAPVQCANMCTGEKVHAHIQYVTQRIMVPSIN